MACLADGAAHLALDKGDAYTVQTKPHGHGDVHALLHASGLLQRWRAGGTKWVCFFQDTNALVFRALPAALGAQHESVTGPGDAPFFISASATTCSHWSVTRASLLLSG